MGEGVQGLQSSCFPIQKVEIIIVVIIIIILLSPGAPRANANFNGKHFVKFSLSVKCVRILRVCKEASSESRSF